jgi:multidrug efflux pump subunit AcrB
MMYHPESRLVPGETYWVTRHATTILFFILVLSAAGMYLAGKIPISVFPETNFPRVVIGVDNGVMPVDQMQVTITKPIEDAVNSVPGLLTVRSTTSRGSAEVSLFFDWNVDMFRTLELVDAALSKVRQSLPADAVITTNRLTFATFPILGYSLTSDSVPLPKLWEIATYDLKPSLNRVDGVSNCGGAGRSGAQRRNNSAAQQAGLGGSNGLRPPECRSANQYR